MTDDRVLGMPDFEGRAKGAIEAARGDAVFHLRGPRTSARRLYQIGGALLPAAREHGVRLLVNDRVDVALVLRADGVHLAERSLATEDVRSLLGDRALVGRSVHDVDAVGTDGGGRGTGRGVDFLVAGAIFLTPSHPGQAGMGPAGLAAVVEVAKGVPVIAIGGIGPGRVAPVIEAGAKGIAVVRAVWDAEDSAASVTALLEALNANSDFGPTRR